MNDRFANDAGAGKQSLVPANCVRLQQDSIRVTVPLDGHADLPHVEVQGAPTVQLVEREGIVQSIEITCTCGEQITLTCEYL